MSELSIIVAGIQLIENINRFLWRAALKNGKRSRHSLNADLYLLNLRMFPSSTDDEASEKEKRARGSWSKTEARHRVWALHRLHARWVGHPWGLDQHQEVISIYEEVHLTFSIVFLIFCARFPSQLHLLHQCFCLQLFEKQSKYRCPEIHKCHLSDLKCVCNTEVAVW